MSLNSTIIKKLAEWHDSPLLFATECMNFKPSDQQADLLQKFPRSKRNTVRSGHGTGKDADVGGVIIPWFLVTRPYAKIVCTAPTAHQLNDILWSEISKWLRQSLVSEEFVIHKDKIFHKDAPKEWWCRAVTASVRSSKEEQAEALAGFHGDHLLIVCDEASGIPDPVYIPLEGALTQEDNWVILIGNMTKNSGYFYDTHFHRDISKQWQKFHWDSRKSSNVKPSMVEYFASKYGVDSNIYRIRVAGDPPLSDDTVYIPLAWAQQCIGNEVFVPETEPLYLSIDVARYGDDASVIMPRTGFRINPWDTYHGVNPIDLVSNIQISITDNEADGVAIDEVGIGGPALDLLLKRNVPNVYGVNATFASSDPTKYHRLRDELWGLMREKCMKGLYSFPDVKLFGDTESLGEMLASELASPKYDFDNNGAVVIESKKEMKRRGIMSPNIADALGLSEYFYNVSTQVFKKKKQTKKRDRAREVSLHGSYYNSNSQSWMVV